MQTHMKQWRIVGAGVLVAATLGLAGCGSHNQAATNGTGSIPANGTPAQIQQAIQQNAARQAAAARNMPRPGAQNSSGGQ
jgi:hypothetical protein